MNGTLFFCRNAAKECFSNWSLKTAEYVKDGWLMTFGHVPMFFFVFLLFILYFEIRPCFLAGPKLRQFLLLYLSKNKRRPLASSQRNLCKPPFRKWKWLFKYFNGTFFPAICYLEHFSCLAGKITLFNAVSEAKISWNWRKSSIN